jgi:hypothetical protein
MKKVTFLILALAFLFFSCKKNNKNDDWTEEDQIFYDNVTALQEQAAENYTTWLLTMDSLEVINQLQQFFLDDSTVTSATIGSQGIAVQYSNGMRGGIFLDPEDDPGDDTLNIWPPTTVPSSKLNEKSLVINKKAILLNPSHWERSDFTTLLISSYNGNLPKAGFSLQTVYKNEEASVDRFTELSGYGIIHIYSHGWAWPENTAIQDVYLKTGEVENDFTTEKYALRMLTGDIFVAEEKAGLDNLGNEIWENIYFIDKEFVASKNDFSKDTVLFYGGFCYSFLGKWTEIEKTFAKGAYFGFDWSVYTNRNTNWAKSLIYNLTDTTRFLPCNPATWMSMPNPAKSYFDNADNRTVTIKYTGDATLTLWRDSAEVETSPITNITQTTATGGGNVKSDGGYTITARGICWGTSAKPTIEGSHTTNGSGTGVFTSNLSGLTLNTPYYVRAYATNSQETVYGNQVTFTTLADSTLLPGVSITYHVVDITPTTAKVFAKVNTDGGSPVTARGVCWSTFSDPTTANDHTSDGSGLGEYTSSLSGLTPDTLYYVRAYATNSSGTAYGNQESFRTLFEPLNIGQSYGGGIIFYIDGTGRHGFVCAPTDQSTGAQWGCDSTEVGGTSAYLGTGQGNTVAILSGCSEVGIAAQICDDLELNGYNDWFLPSLGDLWTMWSEKSVIGGISEASYWSSFEYNAYYGYTQDFTNGGQYYIRKYETNYVRAIRTF